MIRIGRKTARAARAHGRQLGSRLEIFTGNPCQAAPFGSQCAGKYWAKAQDAKLKILEFVYFGQKVRLRIGFSRGAQSLGFGAMAKG
jgi:hypothetical protein